MGQNCPGLRCLGLSSYSRSMVRRLGSSRTHPFLWKLWVPQLRRPRDFRAIRKLFLLKTAQIFSLMSSTSLKCWNVCLALPLDTARKKSLICRSLTVGSHQMLVKWICKWRIDKWKNNEWLASDTSRKKKQKTDVHQFEVCLRNISITIWKVSGLLVITWVWSRGYSHATLWLGK